MQATTPPQRALSSFDGGSRSQSRSRNPETNDGPRRDWADGLRNDDGARVFFGSRDISRMYCDRFLGAEMPGRHGRCGPDDGPQCASCQKLQASRRLPNLRARFPSVGDDVLVAALRAKGGIFADAARHLVELGLQPVPDDRLTKKLARESRLPMAMARVALRENSCDVEAAGVWINQSTDDGAKANLERCFREAASNNQADDQASNGISEQIPAAVMKLASTWATFPSLVPEAVYDRGSLTEEAPSAINGHWMISCPSDGGSPVNCVLCSCCIRSKVAGNFYCQACLLCEGCVKSNVVHSCPGLLNGGHLHSHPMMFALERTVCARCDIGGEDCIGHDPRNALKVTWSCAICDFDVCHKCIRRPAPGGFCRRVGEVVCKEPINDDNAKRSPDTVPNNHQRTLESQVMTIPPPADAAAAEKDLAKAWEGSGQESGVLDVIVGTGRVGRTFDTRGHHSTNGSSQVMTGNSPAVSVLPPEAKVAFERFHKSALSEDSTAPPLLTATNTTLVELILQRSQAVGSQQIREKIYQAVSSGNIRMAGLLLACTMYAPGVLPKISDSNSGSEEMKCWCGEAIDLASSPDGVVGCLHGHPMHSSCAADLLLGGASCPVCREPIFHAPLSASEVCAAEKLMMEAEEGSQAAAKVGGNGEPAAKTSGDGPAALGKGDSVEISSDKLFCAQMQSQYLGWNEDMADICGSTGRVTDVISDGKTEAVRVQLWTVGSNNQHKKRKRRVAFTCKGCGQTYAPGSRVACVHCARCEQCCGGEAETNGSSGPSSVRCCDTVCHDWTLHPSVVALVQKELVPEKVESISEAGHNVAAAKRLAERHMLRLRCELAAVKAARDAVKVDIEGVGGGKSFKDAEALSVESLSALGDMGALGISTADLERARCLLENISNKDENDDGMQENFLLRVREHISAGRLETAARLVRRRNAATTVEAALWKDAYCDERQYTTSCAELSLLAFPAASAPKTGFVLKANSSFRSEDEFVDKDGRLWLRVAPAPEDFIEMLLERDYGRYSSEFWKALVGCKVRRGPDWRHGDQDGGEGNEGVVLRARPGQVFVRWKGNNSTHRYRVGLVNRMEVEVCSPCPPQQGWLCANAKGSEALLVQPISSSLKCSCCDDALLATRFQKGGEVYLTVKTSDICVGDRLLVAATLEEVRVKEIKGDQIYCLFCPEGGIDGASDSIAPQMRATPIWYRSEDLVSHAPTSKKAAVTDEVRIIQGRSRTRHEVALLFPDNKNEAVAFWNASKGPLAAEEPDSPLFASCVGGHLFHTRCFLGVLLSGGKCPSPGCSESLWFPSMSRTDDPAISCGGSSDSTGDAESAMFNVAGAFQSDTSGSGTQERPDRFTEEMSTDDNYRMCPACCTGPFLNENCSDMNAHHGQCTVMALGDRRPGGDGRSLCSPQGAFRASAKEIAESLTHLTEGKTVTDILPRCPTHNVPVMFNGCACCGHPFTEIGWRNLPVWDPDAKEKLALDKTKIAASRLLAAQIRREAAMLQFERDTLSTLRRRAFSG